MKLLFRFLVFALLGAAQICCGAQAWAGKRAVAGSLTLAGSVNFRSASAAPAKNVSAKAAPAPSVAKNSSAAKASAKTSVTKTAAKVSKEEAPAKTSSAAKKKKTASARTETAVKAYITMDLTSKRIVNSQNPDRAVAPASLTKVLSMYVILDQIKMRKLSLDSQVTVSRKAAATGGSSINLQAGQHARIGDLLKGMAVASGNDAAVAVAQHVAGSEEAFVRMMNKKAKELGMTHSVFKNVHGLPAAGQQSTARDLLLMTRSYLAVHPGAVSMFHAQPYLDFQSYRLNTNPLLGKMEGVDGLKTGYVAASGYNLITTARHGKARLVSVLLGAPNKEVRLREAQRLMQEAYAAVDAPAEESKKTASTARQKRS